jgi:PAS domain S-box-containing protein
LGENENRGTAGNIKYMLWVGAIVPALLVSILGFIVLNQFYSSDDDSVLVDHTYEVIIGVHKVEKLMVDLETGQRGFIITGRDNFLEPFEDARKRIFDDISNLKRMVKLVNDNPSQIARLNRMERLVQHWIRTSGTPEIEARKRFDLGGASFDTVSNMLLEGTGKKAVDAVRDTVEDFLAVELSLIKQRKQNTQTGTQATKVVLITGVLLVIFSALLTGLFTSRIILSSDWVKSKHAEILNDLQNKTTLAELSNSILSNLIPALSAQTASMYSIHGDQDQELQRIASYGAIAQETQSKTFEQGQSLVGQCFADGKEIRVTDIPDSYFNIASSLGEATPKEVLLLPINFENSVVAVLELASFSALTKRDMALLHALTENLGVIINNVVTGVRTESLLEEIRISEERAHGIIDGSVDTIITIDQRGTVLSFNLAGEKLFGYRAPEVLGQNVKMLMPEPYHSEHDGYLQNYRDTQEKKIIGIGREVEAKKKDGTIFPMDLAVSEVIIEEQILYSGIIRDVTERKAAEEKLRQANAELEEFAYRTSHDLRSPIVSSIRLLDIANEFLVKQDQETALKSLSHVQGSLKKLDALIGDILVLTEAKSKDEEDQTIDVVVLVNNALQKMEHMEGFERLNIQTDFDFDEAVNAKVSRVTMIVENLISNAIKYQDSNKENSYIRISTYRKNQNFVLEVKDNGLGVPKDQQDKLFSMFKRFHPKIAFGSGLGLYLMKKSADILNGEVSFQDHEDGSIFRLSIPV